MTRQIDTPRDPGMNAYAVSVSDSTPLPHISRGIWVGTSAPGDLTVVMVGDEDEVTFTNVPQGCLLPLSCSYIYSTGTSVSNIVVVY